MFEIRIEGIEPLLAKLNKYEQQVADLHKEVPAELEAWQREDMKRKYPNTQAESAGNQTSATTMIWPTSRTADASKRQRRYQRPKQHRPAVAGPQVKSNRPILRAELLEELWERMRKLLSGAMQWP